MLKWFWKLIDWHFDRSMKNAFWFDEKHYSRFEDGRRYSVTWSGRCSLDMDDELTRKLIVEKMEEIDRNMRKNQPHMYDKYGNFIGGVLKGIIDDNHERTSSRSHRKSQAI